MPVLAFLAGHWRLILALGLAAIIGIQTLRLHRSEASYASLQAEYAQFKGGVEALGRQAQAAAAAKEAQDKSRKEAADAENAKTIAALQHDIARMRAAADSAHPSIVPQAPSGSSRLDLACFDRSALESAFRGFLAEARGLADEGTKATIDLNTAKAWASQQP